MWRQKNDNRETQKEKPVECLKSETAAPGEEEEGMRLVYSMTIFECMEFLLHTSTKRLKNTVLFIGTAVLVFFAVLGEYKTLIEMAIAMAGTLGLYYYLYRRLGNRQVRVDKNGTLEILSSQSIKLSGSQISRATVGKRILILEADVGSRLKKCIGIPLRSFTSKAQQEEFVRLLHVRSEDAGRPPMPSKESVTSGQVQEEERSVCDYSLSFTMEKDMLIHAVTQSENTVQRRRRRMKRLAGGYIIAGLALFCMLYFFMTEDILYLAAMLILWIFLLTISSRPTKKAKFEKMYEKGKVRNDLLGKWDVRFDGAGVRVFKNNMTVSWKWENCKFAAEMDEVICLYNQSYFDELFLPKSLFDTAEEQEKLLAYLWNKGVEWRPLRESERLEAQGSRRFIIRGIIILIVCVLLSFFLLLGKVR